MTSLRRFLLLLLFGFAFGGFLFYAGVVIPIGTQVLGATTQGFVTRHVTRVLNLAVLVTLGLLAFEVACGRTTRSRSKTKSLIILTVLMSFCCLALFVLHPKLDAMLDSTEFAVANPEGFYGLHRIYLWISTIQWLCSLPVLWLLANAPETEAKLPRDKSKS